MYKKALFTMVATALAISCWGQWRPAAEVDTESDRRADGVRPDSTATGWDFHLSAGTSVVSWAGRGDAYLWAAPRFSYRASDRLTVCGGFAAVGSLLGGYELRGSEHSYVPRRSGTQLAAVGVGAGYRVSDRLSIWASVAHVGGWHEALWQPLGSPAMDVGITSVDGGFSYELGDATLLEMHFHFVHDHYGNDALGLLGHPYYGWGVPSWEIF